jgi:hypothetical protein
MERTDRPNFFVKEINMYIEYLGGKLEETVKPITDKQKKYFVTFYDNMEKGVEYYKQLFLNYKTQLDDSTSKNNLMQDLENMKMELLKLKAKIV